MIQRLLPVLGLVLIAAITAPPASAQGARTWEFGMDLGFSLGFIDDVDDNLLSVAVPAPDSPDSRAIQNGFLQSLRVGYNATEVIGVETGLGFSYAKLGSDSLWRLGFSLDGLYNLPTASDTRWFLRGGGLVTVIGGSSDTIAQLGLGAGGGVRLMLGNQWGLRLELGGSRLFENDDFYGRWDLTGTAGFSFYTM